MATNKYPPPSSGKSSAAKFGDFMNARDVTGKNRGDNRAATVKKRADDLKKAFYSPAYPAKPKATNASEGPKKGSAAAAKKKASSEGPKPTAVRKSVSMIGGFANKIERAYPVKARPSNASEGPKKGSVSAARKKAGSEGSKRSGAVGVKKTYRAGLRGGKAYPNG